MAENTPATAAQQGVAEVAPLTALQQSAVEHSVGDDLLKVFLKAVGGDHSLDLEILADIPAETMSDTVRGLKRAQEPISPVEQGTLVKWTKKLRTHYAASAAASLAPAPLALGQVFPPIGGRGP